MQAVLAAARQDLQDHTSTPSLDAQTLLADITGQPRGWLLAHPETKIDESAKQKFQQAITQIQEGQALPYVLGWWEFFGRRFKINPNVLIPRPETELLVEQALMTLRQNEGLRSVLDLGTGSGCIAVTLALEVGQIRVVGSDISAEALALARENARFYQVDSQLDFVRADLLAGFDRAFDLICANLPYVSQDSLPDLEVARKEPHLALDGGTGGVELIRRALEQLPRALLPGGVALIEIDSQQGDWMDEAVKETWGDSEIKIVRDLAGRDRLALIRLRDD
jgi:release factor glutamine methyltransferase